MNTNEWFRNDSWNEEVAALFELKLRRARRKEQYLRIQACTLAKSHPAIAHELLDRYFELPDNFDHAQAHVDRATAFLAEGKNREAMQAYEAALAREAAFPNLLTQAWIELPYLIASSEIHASYERAVEVLEQQKNRQMFPVDRFKWNAACALISSAQGEGATARQFAEAALSAAREGTSGLRYHPTIGLVSASQSEVEARLQRLCAA